MTRLISRVGSLRKRNVVGIVAVAIVLAGVVVAAVGSGSKPTAGSNKLSALFSDSRGAQSGVQSGAAFGIAAPSVVAPRSGAPRSGAPALASNGLAVAASPPDLAKAATASPDVPPGLNQPQVVRTGDISLLVNKGGFGAAFNRATSIAQTMGGFVVNSTIGSPVPMPLPGPVPDANGIDPSGAVGGAPSGSSPGSSAPSVEGRTHAPTSGTLDIRVPGDRFNDARVALEALGTTTVHENLSGNDVSGQLVDLSARIANLQVEEGALRAIEARASTIADILSIQPQLVQVRTEIEQLKGQQSRLTNAVALSSIRVQLAEPGAALTDPVIPHVQSTLARSWSRALHGVQAVTGGVFIVVGYLFPLAVLALMGWAVAVLVIRRRRQRPVLASQAT